MKYNVILLDADGTLFDFLRCEREAIRETMLDVEIEPTEERIQTYSEINDSLWKQLERGEITKPKLMVQRFALFCQRFDLHADAQRMSERYVARLSERNDLIEGAEDFCRRLSQMADLYIVTNGLEPVQKRRFASSSICPFFKGLFISGEIGFEKPDVRYFNEVAKRIPDFDKERALVIGDSLTSDIRGGVNFGVDTFWYNPEGKPLPEGLVPTAVVSSFDEILETLVQGDNI